MMNKLLLAFAMSAMLSAPVATNANNDETNHHNGELIQLNEQLVRDDPVLLAEDDDDHLELTDEERDLRAKKRRKQRRRATRKPTARHTNAPIAKTTTNAPTPAQSPSGSPTGFNIQLDYATSVTDAQRAGFDRARAKWMSVIGKDMAAIACVKAGQAFCGYTFQQDTCIDDLYIGVKIQPIDGVGNIAGSAGPCAMDSAGNIRIGVMQFDSADANNLIQAGAWDATIMHEMGHVLGIGTLWDYNNLMTPQGTTPINYLGANGNAGLDALPNGNGKIIIEDQGGSGTARSHWKESVYDSELMTGYLEPAGVPMPMSLMTVRSLQDMGYSVDVSKADPYSVPSSSSGRRLRTHEKIPVGDDILKAEVIDLDDSALKIKDGRDEEFRLAKEKHQRHRKSKNHGNSA